MQRCSRCLQEMKTERINIIFESDQDKNCLIKLCYSCATDFLERLYQFTNVEKNAIKQKRKRKK